MKKPYLLAYSSTLGTQDEIKACLNEIPGVLWRFDMPNCFYVISEQTAEELSAQIQSCRGNGKGRFIVAEIVTNNMQGWLTPASWYLLNNLTYKPEE